MAKQDEKEDQTEFTEDVDLHELTLEESRLRFQEESDRRSSVESKIGTILTVDAIIVSVVGLFQNYSWILIAAMAAALFSVIIGILGLRVRNYRMPGKDMDDYLQYIDNPPKNIRRKLVMSYMTAISGNEDTDDQERYFKGNRTKNDEKYRNLSYCQILTIVSLGLVLLHSISTVL